jgi:hypothetical protein
MVEKYRIETPVEITTTYQGNVISGEKIAYRYENAVGNYVPGVASILTTPTGLTAANYSNYFIPKLYYDVYNSKGKVLQVRTDSETIVYLWGYNHQYPIAEIKNATYVQVVAQIQGGQPTIDTIAESNTLSPTNLSKLDALRASLPNAQISTYTYTPLVGLLTATDLMGVTTYYEYDSFGRLNRTYLIENNTPKTIQRYDYHYRN